MEFKALDACNHRLTEPNFSPLSPPFNRRFAALQSAQEKAASDAPFRQQLCSPPWTAAGGHTWIRNKWNRNKLAR
jgi:hypothetical protein